MALTKVTTHVLADDIALGGNPTTTTQSAGNNTTRIATTAFVTGAVSDLVDGAPSTLNTLNEIAAALNDDAALNTTLTNSIATKLPLAGGTLTGDITLTNDKDIHFLTNSGSNDGTMITRASGDALRIKYATNVLIFDAVDNLATRFYNSNGVSALEILPNATAADSQVKVNNGNFIVNSGNVGIGTTSVETELHVKGTNNSAGDVYTAVGPGNIPSITIQNAGTTDNNNAALFFRNDSGMRASIGARFNSHSNEETQMRFSTTDTSGNTRERMVLYGDGKLGLGTMSPATLIHAVASGDCELRLEAGANQDARVRFGDATDNDLGYIGFNRNSGYMNFSTVNTSGEAMRIDSAGRLLIGLSSSLITYGMLQVEEHGASAGHGGIVGFFDTDTSVISSNQILRLQFSGDNDATGGVFTSYRDGNSVMGTVYAANGTQVAYGVSSDERLKENIVDASSQLNTIKNIKVREFDWKKNGYHEVGMIAQELNTLVPSAVQEGGDDEMEMPWSVDYAKLTPYLIKAVQEQQTTIQELEARIATLEG